ncbi:DNA polymerase III subunit beta [Pyrinomonas methylaliphatogenes]|uniref:Beta sliding clamp n=1 Tax=Pyrinomonas methylaliphatogenes TaxID=454194 RepID=A0A0B6WZS1_9BACT|nr:DNA polymerase III subunit beta [Pyrinomonas methylaliphatogenes]CDM66783.1 DNA polymerase III, beta subunit [Pyrinomonas methylaliphatogenes]
MEFSIARDALLKELQFLQGVVERRNTIPVLSNLLIESTEYGTVRLLATDLDTTLRCETGAEIIGEGRMLIPARKLFDIVRSLPDGEVHLRGEANNWVELRSGRARFRLASAAPSDFPALPSVGTPSPLEIAASHLSSMIERTIFAITLEEARYTLSGAKFIYTREFVRMVTTDGHRLAFIELKAEPGQGKEIDALIPRKALAELARLASTYDGSLKLWTTENHIHFEIGPRLLVARLLAGQFPNYEMVMPRASARKARLDCALFAGAIRRVALMADDRSRAIRLAFSPNGLQISAQSAEEGSSEERVDVDYDGEEIEIGFNAQYLLDFLQVVGEGEILFEFKDANSQAQLRPVAQDGFDYRYIVMPMRL